MPDPEHESERPEEAERLEMFLGDWRVDGTLDMEDSTARVSGMWKFVRAGDGWGVLAEMVTEIEGMGSINESVLIGYDSEHGKIHHFSMNRLAVRDHVGQWEDQNTLVVEYSSEDRSETITIRFGSEQIKAAVEEKVNGNVVIVTALTLTRL